MPDDGLAHQYMVDPSMVLSEAWLGWAEEEANEDEIREVVVSHAFLGQLREAPDRAFFLWLPEDRQEDYVLYRERALDLIERHDIRSFSFEEVDLPDELRAVQVALLETGDRDAVTLADEWAFLKSSLGCSLPPTHRPMRSGDAVHLSSDSLIASRELSPSR